VYITIDDSAIVTTSRFVANLSGIPINIVSNPKYRITDNPLFTPKKRGILYYAGKGLLNTCARMSALLI